MLAKANGLNGLKATLNQCMVVLAYLRKLLKHLKSGKTELIQENDRGYLLNLGVVTNIKSVFFISILTDVLTVLILLLLSLLMLFSSVSEGIRMSRLLLSFRGL